MELAQNYARLEGKSSPKNYETYFDYFSELKNVFFENLLGI